MSSYPPNVCLKCSSVPNPKRSLQYAPSTLDRCSTLILWISRAIPGLTETSVTYSTVWTVSASLHSFPLRSCDSNNATACLRQLYEKENVPAILHFDGEFVALSLKDLCKEYKVHLVKSVQMLTEVGHQL